MAFRPVTHNEAEGATPTRNPNDERGSGRAFRHEGDMLPRIPTNVQVQQPGRQWAQSRAVEVRKDLTGRPGSMQVNVRSGNTDPAAVGLNHNNWGIAGEGDPTVVAPAKSLIPMSLIIGSLAIAGLFLLRK